MPRIPLVVGVPPTDATAAPKAPGSLESLLETPPIAHHQGKLYLSPSVFGHLSQDQLRHIEGLGAQQALQVLQSYLVTHLKAKMRKAKAPTPPPPPPAKSPSAYDQRLEPPKVPRIPVPDTPREAHIPKDKSDPLSALSALAAHPEAAGLIALLKKQQAGGQGTVKLTAGQLELLQLANRLAMQRKKKQAPGPQQPSTSG